MSLSGVNAGYLDVRNAILRVGTLDVQTIVSGVDTATNIAKTNTILLWDDQGSDMNSPPFILTSATRSTSPPYLELGGGVAHVGIKLPNAWLGAFEVYMSDTTDASIKLHTYTTDTTSYGDTGYELVLNSSGVTLNYDGAQVATAAYTWTNDTWHQVVVGFERGAWTVSVDGTPTLIKDDIEREAVYANVGQYLRIDAASATTTKRVRYVKFAANGQWLQSNTGALSYTQGNVGIGVTNPARTFHVRGQSTVWRLDRDRNSAALHMHRFPTGDWTAPWKGYALGVDASGVDTGEFFIGDYGTAVSGGQTRRLTIDNTGNVIIGTQSTGSHLLEVYGTANTGTLTTTSASITDVTHSTSKDTGALLVTDGGLGVESNIHSTNVFAASHVGVGTTATSYNLDVNGTANVGAITMNSNVYAPNLQVADTASNLVTWNSATGDFMDSGGLISNKLAIVSEQPPAALTAATTTVNGHGKYSVYASNVATNSNAWNAFDQSSSVYWQSTGVYSGGVGGEYLKITFPYKTTLRHVVYTGASGAYTSWAKAANIAGSNDDSTWTQLASFSGFGPTSNDPKTMIVNATTSYKHYKFTITENSGSVNYATVAQLKLFTESFSVDGGIVTTTAASGLETGFTEHPVAPMTDYNTYVEGHGTYEASASSYNAAQSSAEPWRAFDYNTVTGSWRTTGFSNSTYLYTGPDVLVDAGGTRYNGPSLTIKIPYAIVLSHSTFNVWGGTFGYETSPKVGYIFGSNNGVDWYKLFYISDFGFEDVEGGNIKTVSINATTPYTHYAFVCTEKNNTGTATAMNLNEWRLFSATGVTKMDNVLISGELAVHGGALQTSHIKWPKVPLKAAESEGYVVSASSTFSTFFPWKAFDGTYTDDGTWISTYPAYTENGYTERSEKITDVNGVDYDGEWIKIKLPQKITLHSYKIWKRNGSSTRAPSSGTILASNDDVNWYTLKTFTGLTYSQQDEIVDIRATTAYNHYALVIHTLNGGTLSTQISEIELFESTLGVGTSATTAKLTVDGGLGLAKGSQVFAGSDVITEFPKHDRPLTKYPEVAMTAASTGGYVASASNNVGGRYPYDAFNNTNVDGNDCWQVVTESATDGYSDTDGTYTGSTRLSLSSNTPLGEWLKLESPIAFKLKSYKISARNSSAYYNSQAPRDAEIWGSNDDTNWTKITEHSGLEFNSQTDSSSFNVSDDNEKYFKYHAIIVTKNNADEFFAVSIGDWELYGTEEGDESVDVVHRSIPNKPGTQQLAVYYEARDSNSYSFADSSNVYDLSGNGVTGTITGNNGFDAEYNAWVFDGSGDYISTTSSGLGTGGAFDHSFAFWFKINRNITNNDYVVTFGEETNDNMIAVNISGNTLIHFDNWGTGVITGSVVTLGQWYHVACTHTGSATGDINNQLIYVNGVRQSTSATGTGTLAFTSNRITIGARPGTNNSNTPAAFLDGAVADVRFYKGKVLNADQVRELYEYDAERFGHRQNLVALHKGNLGVGVTNPTSRFEVAGADGLQEYPPKAMTGYETYIEGHGVFRASASSTWSTNEYLAFGAFNKTFLSGNPNLTWNSVLGGFSSGSDYAYIGTNSLGGISGEWLKLSTPHAIKPSEIRITASSNYISNYAPEDFYLLGSMDDVNWYVLSHKTGETWSSLSHSATLNTTDTYKYFALVVTKTRGETSTHVTEMQVFGTPAPSSLEDGHLTLGKALTLPRVSGHPAGAETPRAESLVVHYDTTVDSVVSGSTVVDISGTGNNGTLNGAVYDTTERALTFDGVDDYVSGTLNNPAGAWVHSVSCWYKPLSTTTGVVWAIGTNSNSKQIAINNDGGVIKYFIYGCSGTPSPTSTFTTNKWHHIVAVFRNSETTATGGVLTGRDLYIDGVKQTMTAINTQFALNLNANITFRLANQYNSLYNHSSISNFKLWNVALTAEEVAAEYTLGRTGKSINLTDTTLCLGGTVPRAQLDVRGVAYIDKLHLGASGTSLTPPKTAAMFATSTHSSNYSHLDSTWRDVWHHDFDSNWNFRLAQYHDPGVTVKHGLRWKHNAVDDNNITFYGSNVGIGTTSPGTKTHIHQSGTGSNDGLRLSTSSSQYWDIYNSSGNDLAFRYGGGSNGGYIQDTVDVANIDFTGQHRNFIDGVPYTEYDTLEGLIVSANKNKYYDINEDITTGANAIQISQSLPLVSLSTKEKDKACFGVISGSEDPEKREYSQGSFVSVVQKQKGDRRAFINSLGEGAMWVTNINGPLESGDYITTSNVAGYGQRQDDDILHNYTVAKITMDCDFEPPDIPVQRILKELSNITYWYQLEDATSNAYDRTQEETYYTLDRRVEVYGHVDEQSNVFVEPVHDLELYTKTQENIVSEEVYNALPEDERVLYDSNTFTYTQVTELAPEVWADLDGEEQNTYVRDYFNIVTDEVPSETPGAVECTRTVYKKIVNETKVEPATPEDYFSEVRQEWVNVLDAHGQLQWEDVPWGETEPAYKVRYLDADGKITTRHNEVHRAAFVGVTYHCG
jgi:hypothetical protein